MYTIEKNYSIFFCINKATITETLTFRSSGSGFCFECYYFGHVYYLQSTKMNIYIINQYVTVHCITEIFSTASLKLLQAEHTWVVTSAPNWYCFGMALTSTPASCNETPKDSNTHTPNTLSQHLSEEHYTYLQLVAVVVALIH